MARNQSNFVRDFQNEFKKIEWPKKDFLVRSSIITIFMVIFFTIYIAGSDFILSKIIFGIRN
ncbi:MAG: preprotein translocase subunit SecE [Candidatus Marinamargulisbacteria bacterium]